MLFNLLKRGRPVLYAHRKGKYMWCTAKLYFKSMRIDVTSNSHLLTARDTMGAGYTRVHCAKATVKGYNRGDGKSG